MLTSPEELEDQKNRPRRVMELTGGFIRGKARIVFERKYGVWFIEDWDAQLSGQRLDLWGCTEWAMIRFCRNTGATYAWL